MGTIKARRTRLLPSKLFNELLDEISTGAPVKVIARKTGRARKTIKTVMKEMPLWSKRI